MGKLIYLTTEIYKYNEDRDDKTIRSCGEIKL